MLKRPYQTPAYGMSALHERAHYPALSVQTIYILHIHISISTSLRIYSCPGPKVHTSYEVHTSQASYRFWRHCFSHWYYISRPVGIWYLPKWLCHRRDGLLCCSWIYMGSDSGRDRTSQCYSVQHSLWAMLRSLRCCCTHTYALVLQSRTTCALRSDRKTWRLTR